MEANRFQQEKITKIVLTILRIFVGWHFLYEGISKLATPGWSSASYLMESKWLFSGFFHWIISNPTVLATADFLNIWGLIFIGLGLFVGMFTRLSSISGILILLLYYIANPPFVESSMAGQGHYFFINQNLIEAAILLVFAMLKKDYLWSLDRFIKGLIQHKKDTVFPDKENHEPAVNSRREMVKNLASIPILGVVFFGMAKKSGWLSFEENNLEKTDAITSASKLNAKTWDIGELKGEIPKGKIKHVEISRIIPGGNLIAGFAHARDLIYVSEMIKNYFTDEKVIETLWLYEACGINTTMLRTDENTIRIMDKYRKRGGKIQWIAQTYPKENDLTNVKMAVDGGAVGAFVMGNIADGLVFNNKMEQIAKPVEYMKSQGLIAGTAGHAIRVPMACIESGIENDFFMKTIHHDKYWSAHPSENRDEFMHDLQYDSIDRTKFRDNMWCASPEKVTAFFEKCKTPWIGYKVLAAGAIQPEDGFKYAFENGADFICVGMFDFQVIPNANTVHNIFNSNLNRKRKWFA